MIEQLPTVVAILLAGLAAAGLVSSPATQLGRLGRRADVDHDLIGGGSATAAVARWIRRSGLLEARADALPSRTRMLAGASGGMVVVLCWQSLSEVGLISWLISPPVAASVYLALGRVEAPAARRRRMRMVTELPHVLELLAAAMSAGLPLRAAVREVTDVAEGPLIDDLVQVLKSIDLGQDDAEAWRRLRDHPALGRVSVDLARSVESGTMVVGTLRRHARLARRNRRGALEAQAKTVGVKSVPPLVFCFVPAFLLVSIVPAAVTALRDAVL